MKTLLYKPLFINPQAYYVFPNINGRLEPKTGSGKEPAIFVGNIEVKTIAHGDIGKKQYFYNTNEIDLSAFSNSLVRISLYTSRGNVVLGEWNLDVVKGESEDYIDPEVLASLVAVCICDGKSNNDPDRAVIKNLVDPGNPFVISNAAYKLNSGYGKYEEDFTTWRISKTGIVSTINVNSIHITRIESSLNEAHAFFENATTTNKKFNIKLKISGLTSDMKCTLNNQNSIIKELVNGVNEISADLVIGWYGFTIIKLDGSIIGDCDITITQIPSHQGAFVTDGKDDLITSTKTVKEMLGGSNKVTVVSMMLNLENEKFTYTNQIRPFQNGYIRNNVISNTEGKCGIYGYKITNISDIFKNGISINDILGDSKDYSMDTDGTARIDGKFSVEGYCFNDGTIGEMSQVAWYWTFIANKVLTTDQINQVISYFNLDKHVKPDVYYDVKKQGLSNDTPEADWYLKDFSGNGHDMTLYNFAKKLGSGIGKYEVDFNTWIPQSYVADSTYTSNKLHITKIKEGNAILYTEKEVNAMKVKITGIQSFDLVYRYIAENDVWGALKIVGDGIYELPASTTTTKSYYAGFMVLHYTGDCDITIEQIPDYEGALVSDGIDDYGNAENLPILKDYTVAIERQWITSPVDKNQCLAFKGHTNDWGAFACEISNAGQLRSYTFSPVYNILQSYNEKSLVYQSKYSYSGTPIDAKATIDGSTLRLCFSRGDLPFYANVAIKMFLLFPYTLSEFLLERQLKRYKLGTLYPGMVEFRPIINVNIGRPYNVFEIRRMDTIELLYYYINGSVPNNKIGSYLPKGTNIRILVKWDNNRADVTQIKFNGKEYELNRLSDNSYYIDVTLDKSPQKIDIYADEYIRYEDIVQPYPAIINLKQDGKTITWGDKLKVGSDIVFVGSANLLPELYTVSETRYNGVTLYPNTIIKAEKSMVFDNARTYLKANEPSCILAPQTLRIPNSSYKILGYIPDLTGKGNHGRLKNFAYMEESGANEDGSIRFDGTDDHIIIPTIKHGGKALLMKVNWRYKNHIAMAYGQRINWIGLGISISRDQLPLVAYKPYNKVTYIDGIKNESVLVQDLEGITHNITGIYDNLNLSDKRDVCISRTSDASNSGFADMSMYEFMLFPDVPNEEEIKELNDIVGIEGNTDDLLTKTNI